MRSHLITSGLAIALAFSGVIAPAVGQPIDRTIGQVDKTGELERAIAEGVRLGKEGSKESLISAIRQFEIVARLSQVQNDKAKQASALDWLGFIYNALGKKQRALDYHNRALPLRRAVGDQGGEGTTLTNIGAVYSAVGEKQKGVLDNTYEKDQVWQLMPSCKYFPCLND